MVDKFCNKLQRIIIHVKEFKYREKFSKEI